ncbi:hypothetical protein RND81_06G147700 [Saponaria officinalis]|uniref:Uncharacterized protein n=1 Tax=Saponaria officinalis TaxID=3572 RepID=A0AAW1KA59_SAPOF
MKDSVTISGIIKLTATNYPIWKPRMKDILYCKDLHHVVETSTKPDDKTEDAWNTINRKVVGLIRQFIDQSVFQHVANYTMANIL